MILNRSNIPSARLEKLINFSRPNRIKLPLIIVKNCVCPYDADFHYGWINPYIILRFGNYKHFPLYFKLSPKKIKRTGYFGEYYIPTKTCAIIFSAAHELKHYEQHCHPTKRFWLYHDLKLAEKEADDFAFKRMKKYLDLKEQGIDPLK